MAYAFLEAEWVVLADEAIAVDDLDDFEAVCFFLSDGAPIFGGTGLVGEYYISAFDLLEFGPGLDELRGGYLRTYELMVELGPEYLLLETTSLPAWEVWEALPKEDSRRLMEAGC